MLICCSSVESLHDLLYPLPADRTFSELLGLAVGAKASMATRDAHCLDWLVQAYLAELLLLFLYQLLLLPLLVLLHT